MRSSHKRARIDPEDVTPDGGYKVKTYYPTLSEMKNFSAYIKKIHDDNGHRAGLAKIVPPREYIPRKAGYGDDKLYNMEITNPIKQKVTGERGLYQQFNVVERKKISVRAFKKLAEEKYSTPIHRTHEELERIFWKNIFIQPAIYGADVSGSLYDDDVKEFNLTKLNTILDNIGDDYGVTIQGVNTAYLYFGMWKSSFSWHTEDMDLYSINYLHDGQPKSWYCIAPEHGKRFERLAASFFPHSYRTCKAFLRHKTTIISPQVLKKYSIPFSRCTQQKGEFMITFPFSYHSGYNHGFNIAEATNFALEYWIDFGKWASRCECSAESVKISMQTFVKRYQSERYENWIRGKDICKDPRDPKHVAAAPKPTEYDLYLMGNHERNNIEGEDENIETNNNNSKKNISEQNEEDLYPELQETIQRYSDYLRQVDNREPFNKPMKLTHYSPIPSDMVEVDLESSMNEEDDTDEPYKFVTRNPERIKLENSTPPDYQREVAEMEAKQNEALLESPKQSTPEIKYEILPVGSQIVARASNNYYYDGIVYSRQLVPYFSVYFPESSTTENFISTKRIIDNGPEKKWRIGDKISVRINKSYIQEGKYKGQEIFEEYSVQFHNEKKTCVALEKVARENIYLNIDQMPEDLLPRYHGSVGKNTQLLGDEIPTEDDDNDDEDEVNDDDKDEADYNGENVNQEVPSKKVTVDIRAGQSEKDNQWIISNESREEEDEEENEDEYDDDEEEEEEEIQNEDEDEEKYHTSEKTPNNNSNVADDHVDENLSGNSINESYG